MSESRSGAPWAQRCFVLSATVTPSPRGVEVCECLTVSVNSTGWLVETVLRGSPFSVPVMRLICNHVLHSSGLTFQSKLHSVSLLLVSKVVITVYLPLNVNTGHMQTSVMAISA